jgi:hypothetical protein
MRVAFALMHAPRKHVLSSSQGRRTAGLEELDREIERFVRNYTNNPAAGDDAPFVVVRGALLVWSGPPPRDDDDGEIAGSCRLSHGAMARAFRHRASCPRDSHARVVVIGGSVTRIRAE